MPDPKARNFRKQTIPSKRENAYKSRRQQTFIVKTTINIDDDIWKKFSAAVIRRIGYKKGTRL